MDHVVQFETDPNDFGDALNEVSRNLEQTDGVLFICAIGGADSELFQQQSCVANPAELENNERLVLGLEGKNQSFTFVDIPASVQEEGMFVIGRVGELSAWATEASGQVAITYQAEGVSNRLRIDYPSGHDQIDVQLLYRETDFDQYFDAHLERWYTPDISAHNEDLAETLNLGKKVAPSGQRTGDLIFGREHEMPHAEFVTRQRLSRVMVSTSQRTKLPEEYPLSGFEWEITSDQLAQLKRIVSNSTSTGRVEEKYNEHTEDTYYSLQFAYETELSSGAAMHVHHQTTAFRDNPPLNNWATRSEIFENENCKLFAAVDSEELGERLNTTWALRPDKVMRGRVDEEEDGTPVLSLHTRSDGEVANQKNLPITSGDSQIEQYLFMPGAYGVAEKILDDAPVTQIRSFPAQGEERPNAYVVVPVEEETSPDHKPERPDRYAIINWQDQ